MIEIVRVLEGGRPEGSELERLKGRGEHRGSQEGSEL